MMEKIRQLKEKAFTETRQAKGPEETEKIWRRYLGRQDGQLTIILRGLKNLSLEQKRQVGAFANQVKKEIEDFLNERKQGDVSSVRRGKDFCLLPGKAANYGHLHPLTRMRDEVADIFSSMGFEIWEGEEVQTDYYNFESLNIPAGHPARDMWDTFYLQPLSGEKKKERLLLMTHTSAMQVRIMKQRKPPLRACVIGRCFRHEATDASHEHTLYQVEGFMVDENVTVANLVHVLRNFLNVLFDREVRIRMRPSYFPFTEPSFEVDFACLNCQGKGCPVCKQTGWVEILGSGMIHPAVFKHAGYPAGKYTGFAFGVGLDRLAMMKYKISDIRLFHGGDLRFVKQF